MWTRCSGTWTICWVVALSGCLPVDTRPEPGRVLATVDLPAEFRSARGQSTEAIIWTEDDWTVRLDTMLVSIGNLELTGTACNEYSEANYRRLLDLRQPGPQKVGEVWGLNGCLPSYSVGRPREDAVLGLGVSKADVAFMRNAVVPVSKLEGVATAIGMALHVRGSIRRGEVSVDFDWGFSDNITWTDCQRWIDGELESPLPLVAGTTTNIELLVDPRRLLRADPSATGSSEVTADDGELPLVQYIVDADRLSGNANGIVAVDELAAVVLPESLGNSNLAELLRQISYPSMFRYGEDGRCRIGRPSRGGPGGGL